MATDLVVVVEGLVLVVGGALWLYREHKWRAIAGLRVGLANEFTGELCAGIQRKLGYRKGQRVMNEAMRKARDTHNRKVMGIVT